MSHQLPHQHYACRQASKNTDNPGRPERSFNADHWVASRQKNRKNHWNPYFPQVQQRYHHF
ncbi:MAG: hypothetical protein WCL60_04060 [Methylococcales bacterium]